MPGRSRREAAAILAGLFCLATPGRSQAANARGEADARQEALPAVRPPDPAQLLYAVQGRIKGFRYSASAELLWQHADGQYHLRQTIRMPLIGARTQGSQGRLGAQGLEPQRFDDRTPRRTRWVRLDGALAHFSNAPDAAPQPIAPGAQDRLSVFLQLAARLAGAPQRHPAGTQIALETVSASRVERWTFRVDEWQTLALPARSMQALRLERMAAGRHQQQAALWLAPALQYLPVRIELVQDNGDRADMQLQQSKWLGACRAADGRLSCAPP